MRTIKFSHDYPKLHGQTGATLVQVRIIQAESLSESLIKYDTVFWENGKEQFYPLPKKGEVIQLLFFGNEGIPFCTIRRHTPEKERYYTGSIGYEFQIVIEAQP